ncbi:MAG TPA: hypothetical protein PL137_21435 [Nocardioides sp.]|nr:hypothetical protein [Nocardioides sp.]
MDVLPQPLGVERQPHPRGVRREEGQLLLGERAPGVPVQRHHAGHDAVHAGRWHAYARHGLVLGDAEHAAVVGVPG